MGQWLPLPFASPGFQQLQASAVVLQLLVLLLVSARTLSQRRFELGLSGPISSLAATLARVAGFAAGASILIVASGLVLAFTALLAGPSVCEGLPLAAPGELTDLVPRHASAVGRALLLTVILATWAELLLRFLSPQVTLIVFWISAAFAFTPTSIDLGPATPVLAMLLPGLAPIAPVATLQTDPPSWATSAPFLLAQATLYLSLASLPGAPRTGASVET